METRPRSRLVAWAAVLLAGALSMGCGAGNQATLRTLREARATLDLAKSAGTPAARDRILEAEGALSYAEQEYRLSPGHPLTEARAENALTKARAAYQATGQPPSRPLRHRYAAH